jgi:hypothetical protein
MEVNIFVLVANGVRDRAAVWMLLRYVAVMTAV